MDAWFRFTCRPVSVSTEATVNTLLGQGNMQLLESRISQRSALGVSILIGTGSGSVFLLLLLLLSEQAASNVARARGSIW